MCKLAVILLASGFSSRFGSDNKLLMPYKTSTVIETVMGEILASDISQDIIVITQYQKIIKLYESNKLTKVIKNKEAATGISASVKLGIEAAASVEGYLFIPGDQVGLKRDVLDKLVREFHKNKDHVIVPCYNDQVGSPKIFPKSLRPDLLKLKGDEGGRGLIKKEGALVHYVKILDVQSNDDIDTQEDYKRLREANK